MSQTSGFLLSDPTISLASRTTAPLAVRSRVVSRRSQSRFESMTAMASEATATAGELIDGLLASTLPVSDRGCEVLRPLWAEEALHRAYSFIRLIDARNPPRLALSGLPTVTRRQAIAVRDLALRFRELVAADERAVLPCAAVLRDIVASIATLFAGPANIKLAIQTDSVRLPGYQRQALVLAAVELVNNALLHAFPGPAGGRIELRLTRRGDASACLSVADSGMGFTNSLPNPTRGVASGLAGLLEADVKYDRIAGWTIAEITFPVAGF